MRDNFCQLILTHGRADRVYTYQALRDHGYTGRIYLVVDDMDSQLEEYKERYGDQVLVFSKAKIAPHMDSGDNFPPRAVIYARNVSHDLAKSVGCKYFMQLDDDYMDFRFRFDSDFKWSDHNYIENMDAVLEVMIEFYEASGATALAMAQNGDFIGGAASPSNPWVRKIALSRKAMNSFLCSVERPFQFQGQLNDDVNTYVGLGRKGELFLTSNLLTLKQKATQTNPGGLTELYLDLGTYVKSFYTVMFEPSCCSVAVLNSSRARIHHSVCWKKAVPKILSEKLKKEPKPKRVADG